MKKGPDKEPRHPEWSEAKSRGLIMRQALQ